MSFQFEEFFTQMPIMMTVWFPLHMACWLQKQNIFACCLLIQYCLHENPYTGPHRTGKTGKRQKEIPCQGKHRGFGKYAKTQGIKFAQVLNSLILKVKNIRYFLSVLCM